MIYTGCHLSSAKGFEAMGKNALKLGADTFAFFTRNPRGGNAKAIDHRRCGQVSGTGGEASFWKDCCPRALYTEPLRGERGGPDFAFRAFQEDLVRMEYIGKLL